MCPITRCAKSQFNGPCGGSRAGKCEVDESVDCAWQLIYDRAKAISALGRFEKIAVPQYWSMGIDGRVGARHLYSYSIKRIFLGGYNSHIHVAPRH